MPEFNISARKRTEPGSLIFTKIDDPDACLFRLNLPGVVHWDSPEFKTKFEAESQLRIFRKVFDAGKKKARQEIRDVIGCK